jgi:murein DD-endopeptidase MepM/ murein hydrolase activator NlpD
VQTVSKDGNLGLHVIVEHRLPSGEVFFSIYGHLDTAWVTEGQAVEPAGTVGTVGLTGNTTAPHVHLQVDRDDGSSPHRPFSITSAGMHGAAVDIPSPAEADRHTVNPITFIERYREGLL